MADYSHNIWPNEWLLLSLWLKINNKGNKTLLRRAERVQEIVGNKKTVMSVLVTTYGLKRNEYASRFDRIVTMEDLFQK